jgi:hypothetical protein
MRFLFMLALLLLAATPAFAGGCDDMGTVPQSMPLNITTATTTKIVSALAGHPTFVCSISGTVTGTSPTFKLEYGTQTSTPCDTGTTALSGTIAPTAGTPFNLGYGRDLVIAPPGQQLCIVTGGTSPSLQGIISFEQR